MKNMTNEQLIRATYVVAKFKDPETAKLLTELAGRLDCALVAARTACLERDSSVKAEIEWETAMRKAVGEDGVDDVVLAIEKLKAALDVQSARSDALAAELKQSKIDAECYKHGMEQSNKRLTEIAAENAALKSGGNKMLSEACAVYAKLNKLIDPEIGDFIDGQTLHEFQFLLDTGTTNTDAWVNEQRAVGVEMFALMYAEEAIKSNNITTGWRAKASRAASEYAEQLRGGQA